MKVSLHNGSSLSEGLYPMGKPRSTLRLRIPKRPLPYESTAVNSDALDVEPETHQSTGVDRHLLFSVKTVLSTLWQPETRSTWAYPDHYSPALAYSILSLPSPLGLPCGRLALEGPRRDQRLFHVPHSPQDGLGPLCTPEAQRPRRATLESPNLAILPFWSEP
jgi:hypothetical protein